MALVVAGLLIMVVPTSEAWVFMAGLTIASVLGVPLLLARTRLDERFVLAVAVLAIAVVATIGWGRANSDLPVRDRVHDGGVLVTRAGAEDLFRGRNPYRSDFLPALPPEWQEVQGSDGEVVANPVRFHYPYLPAAVLVHVPFVAVADGLGRTWDPRWLGFAALVAAIVVVARTRAPAWARIGGILGVGSLFSAVYLAWGTNDVFAVSLAILAVALAVRRPALAGVLLAVALSAKLLLVPLVPALGLALWLRGGAGLVKRWWTLPATFVVTCLPFLVISAGPLLDDTIWFNLGRSEPRMPTSGLGLPAVAPGLPGGVVALATLLGLAFAFGFPVLAVRRRPSVWVAAAASGAGLLGLLIPARTFQPNYLVLVASLVGLVWMAATDRAHDASDTSVGASGDPDSTGEDP